MHHRESADVLKDLSTSTQQRGTPLTWQHFLDSYLVAIDDGRWRNFRGRRTQLTRTEPSDRELAIQILDCTHLIR